MLAGIFDTKGAKGAKKKAQNERVQSLLVPGDEQRVPDVADPGKVKISDFPAWRAVEAKQARLDADFQEAKAELAKAESEAAQVGEVGEIARYLRGEIELKDLGVESRHVLDEAREKRRRAERQVSLLNRAEAALRREKSDLQAPLCRVVAEMAWASYRKKKQRIALALAELAAAVEDEEAFLEDLERRGFPATSMRGLFERRGSLGLDAYEAMGMRHPALSAVRGGQHVRRFLGAAEKAWGVKLPKELR